MLNDSESDNLGLSDLIFSKNSCERWVPMCETLSSWYNSIASTDTNVEKMKLADYFKI